MDPYYFEYDNSVLYCINAEGNAELVESRYQNHRGLCAAVGELGIPIANGRCILPEHIQGHPLVAIWENALENKELLFFPPDQKGHYSVPEGTKRIAAFAFSRCALTGITLPESLESIGQYAFMSCQNLQTVEGLRETIKCDKDAFPFLQYKKKGMQS